MSSSSSSEVPPSNADLLAELVGVGKEIATCLHALALRHGDQPTCESAWGKPKREPTAAEIAAAIAHLRNG